MIQSSGAESFEHFGLQVHTMAELASVDEGFVEEVSDEESDHGSIPELESIPGSIETDEGAGDCRNFCLSTTSTRSRWQC